MGQRFLQLTSTYTGSTSDNQGILHVQQLPPNAAILVPGPALLFVVVNGVPSVGVQVMVGSGQIGQQQMQPAANLPTSAFVQSFNTNGSTVEKNSSPVQIVCHVHIRFISVMSVLVGVVTLLF
jgi:hypothetical protein